MDGSIYDFGDFGLRRAVLRSGEPPFESATSVSIREHPIGRVGLITNPRSHRNRMIPTAYDRPEVLSHAPRTRAELRDVLATFAGRGIDLLAIDGGDGTIRDVLTCAGDIWADKWPGIAILPRGKTNALAVDLRVPASWTLDEAIAAAARGKYALRGPLEIERRDTPGIVIRGFLLGAGAFVNATALAQRTHRAGAFNGMAVGLALTWTVVQTLFGGPTNAWRSGDRIAVAFGEQTDRMHGCVPDGLEDRYLVLATTLQRMPLGLKPFGKPRRGMKALIIDAPPRKLVATVGPLLAGSEIEMLERAGYHRADPDVMLLDIASSVILDGETFPGGSYVIREAAPLRFVVP